MDVRASAPIDRAVIKIMLVAMYGKAFQRLQLMGAVGAPLFLLWTILDPDPLRVFITIGGVFLAVWPINAEGFEISSPTGTSKRDWSLVKVVRETGTAWVFESAVKGCTVGMPKKFCTEQQHVEMRRSSRVAG